MASKNSTIILKIKHMKHYCPNGLEYFCDGTPNKSRCSANSIKIKPCPKRFNCAIKKGERFDPSKGGEENDN